jgi:hypothetical protein
MPCFISVASQEESILADDEEEYKEVECLVHNLSSLVSSRGPFQSIK